MKRPLDGVTKTKPARHRYTQASAGGTNKNQNTEEKKTILDSRKRFFLKTIGAVGIGAFIFYYSVVLPTILIIV